MSRPPSSASLSGARVLVVEDEFMVAALLEDTLKGFGCEVVVPAPDLAQALALLASAAIDVAVLDVNINGEMVFPVADVLAARRIPFVFEAAYEASGVAARHGDRAALDKPYHDGALEHALRSALQGRSRR